MKVADLIKELEKYKNKSIITDNMFRGEHWEFIGVSEYYGEIQFEFKLTKIPDAKIS